VNRVTYSAKGFLRSLQVSRVHLHVFVEGRQLDPYLYGRLCEHACGGPFSYKLTRADQIPGALGGGKTVLLAWYDRLRRQKRLIDDFKGHRYGVVFFLDKDIDDITRRMRRSIHVIYTPTYDVEGLVYRHGDLLDAVAAACSLDRQAAATVIGSDESWRQKAMSIWKEWLLLCCLGHMLAIHGSANFGSSSQVNPTLFAQSDRALITTKTKVMRQRCSPPIARFDRARKRMEARLDSLEQASELDILFKGKWLSIILEAELRHHFPTEINRVSNFRQQVVGNLAQSVDVTEQWTNHYVIPLRSILGSL
jgi:hypothetical protein